MAVFRVERTQGYTVMSNYHLRDKSLSLKAKGLLSQMLSLPEDWDYTLSGLAVINRESKDAIRSAVNELEKAGYIKRRQTTDAGGKFSANEYVIYERPVTEEPASPTHTPLLEKPLSGFPTTDNPATGKPSTENPTQISIEKLNTQKSITDGSITDSLPFRRLCRPFPREGAGERIGKEWVIDKSLLDFSLFTYIFILLCRIYLHRIFRYWISRRRLIQRR